MRVKVCHLDTFEIACWGEVVSCGEAGLGELGKLTNTCLRDLACLQYPFIVKRIYQVL